jgi:SagB-type dehydrogenase family enzyme
VERNDAREILAGGDGMELINVYGQRRNLIDEVEVFHESTKYGDGLRMRQQHRILSFFSDTECKLRQRNAHKRYEFYRSYALPDPRPVATPLSDCAARRTSCRAYSGEPIPLSQLGDVLFAGLGALDREGSEGSRAPRRPYASAGALYPIEPYIVAINAHDLPAGVFHYDSLSHALSLVRPIRFAEFSKVLFGNFKFIDKAAFVLVLTAMFARSCVKYGQRGYVFSLLEAGAIAQNVTLGAIGTGLAAVSWGGYNDDRVHKLLGINGVDEAVVANLVVGVPVDG